MDNENPVTVSPIHKRIRKDEFTAIIGHIDNFDVAQCNELLYRVDTAVRVRAVASGQTPGLMEFYWPHAPNVPLIMSSTKVDRSADYRDVVWTPHSPKETDTVSNRKPFSIELSGSNARAFEKSIATGHVDSVQNRLAARGFDVDAHVGGIQGMEFSERGNRRNGFLLTIDSNLAEDITTFTWDPITVDTVAAVPAPAPAPVLVSAVPEPFSISMSAIQSSSFDTLVKVGNARMVSARVQRFRVPLRAHVDQIGEVYFTGSELGSTQRYSMSSRPTFNADSIIYTWTPVKADVTETTEDKIGVTTPYAFITPEWDNPMMRMSHGVDISIDLENMGLHPDSPIIAVGAVATIRRLSGELEVVGKFYSTVNLAHANTLGFKTDASTVQWWMGQSAAARARFDNLDKAPKVGVVMAAFHGWVKSVIESCQSVGVWGNDETIDIVQLLAHMRAVGLDRPWHFTSHRCVRTIVDAAMFITNTCGNEWWPERKGILHDALDDAEHQAKIVRAAMTELAIVAGRVRRAPGNE